MATHNLPPSLFFQQRDRRGATRANLVEMGPPKDPLVDRSLFSAVGTTKSGKRVPAFPGIAKLPLDLLGMLPEMVPQMAKDVSRAVTLPRDWFQGKPMTMDDVANFALTFMGGGLAAGAGAKGIGMGAKPGIRTYHGSPHEYSAERLIQHADGQKEFIVGKPDVLPDVPPGAQVLQDYPLGRMRTDKIGTGEGAQVYSRG